MSYIAQILFKKENHLLTDIRDQHTNDKTQNQILWTFLI